jgi:hypothetical protein
MTAMKVEVDLEREQKTALLKPTSLSSEVASGSTVQTFVKFENNAAPVKSREWDGPPGFEGMVVEYALPPRAKCAPKHAVDHNGLANLAVIEEHAIDLRKGKATFHLCTDTGYRFWAKRQDIVDVFDPIERTPAIASKEGGMTEEERARYMKELAPFLQGIKAECVQLHNSANNEQAAKRAWRKIRETTNPRQVVSPESLGDALFEESTASPAAKKHVARLLLRSQLYAAYFSEADFTNVLPRSPEKVMRYKGRQQLLFDERTSDFVFSKKVFHYLRSNNTLEELQKYGGLERFREDAYPGTMDTATPNVQHWDPASIRAGSVDAARIQALMNFASATPFTDRKTLAQKNTDFESKGKGGQATGRKGGRGGKGGGGRGGKGGGGRGGKRDAQEVQDSWTYDFVCGRLLPRLGAQTSPLAAANILVLLGLFHPHDAKLELGRHAVRPDFTEEELMEAGEWMQQSAVEGNERGQVLAENKGGGEGGGGGSKKKARTTKALLVDRDASTRRSLASAPTPQSSSSSSFSSIFGMVRSMFGDAPAAPTAPPARGRSSVFTIDDASTRDIDDAVSIYRDGDDASKVWVEVHVADVERWIRRDSSMMKMGRGRLSSLYLPDGTYPMLPLVASTGSRLSILPLPGVDNDTLSIRMQLCPESAEILHYEVVPTSISGDDVCRTTYKAVDKCLAENGAAAPADGHPDRVRQEAWVDKFEEVANVKCGAPCSASSFAEEMKKGGAGGQQSPFEALGLGPPTDEFTAVQAADLNALYEVARKRELHRMSTGARVISLPEYKIKVDHHPETTGSNAARIKAGSSCSVSVSPEQLRQGRAQLLVSELMVMANQAAANFCTVHDLPVIFRGQVRA